MDVKDRIFLFLEKQNLSKAEFERRSNLSNGYLNNFKGRLGAEKLEYILSAFPQLNRTWLLTGTGEMLNSEMVGVAVPGSDYLLVPLINLDAVGGMHVSNAENDVAQYTLGLVPFPRAETGDVCMRVSGNSMIPTYPPGTILLLRAVPEWREYFGYGHTFVIGLKDGRRILKEVTRSEEDPKNKVLCVSHNKEFPAEELPKSMIVSVYKVIMSLTNEGY